MAVSYLSLPFETRLCQERGWIRPDPSVERFRIVRFHLALDEHAMPNERARMGDRLGVHYAEDAHVDLIRSIEVDLTLVDVQESIRTTIFTEELLEEVSSEISAGIATTPMVAKAALRTKLAEKVSNGITDVRRLEQTRTRSVRCRFEIKYQFDFKSGQSIVNVAMYERRAVDAYLVWADFLDVEYSRTTLGLRKRRVKHPAFIDGRAARQNEVELRVPLGAFRYWRLLPESSYAIREENYRNPILDTTAIERMEIAKPRLFEKKYCDSDILSLYALSNAAFPLRWVDRKGDWTREELEAIELDEARDSVWWFQNGPGLFSRRGTRSNRGHANGR